MKNATHRTSGLMSARDKRKTDKIHKATEHEYLNADSGLEAKTTQAAIDELDARTDGLEGIDHTHPNKAELDLITDGDHDVRLDNPHQLTAEQLGFQIFEDVVFFEGDFVFFDQEPVLFTVLQPVAFGVVTIEDLVCHNGGFVFSDLEPVIDTL